MAHRFYLLFAFVCEKLLYFSVCLSCHTVGSGLVFIFVHRAVDIASLHLLSKWLGPVYTLDDPFCNPSFLLEFFFLLLIYYFFSIGRVKMEVVLPVCIPNSFDVIVTNMERGMPALIFDFGNSINLLNLLGIAGIALRISLNDGFVESIEDGSNFFLWKMLLKHFYTFIYFLNKHMSTL